MSLTQRFISDAFRDMQRAMAMLEQPLYNTARRSMLASPNGFTNQLMKYPATDMVEHPDSFELKAELPGFDKDKIKIELADSRTLVLSGEHKEEHSASPETSQEANNEEKQLNTTQTEEKSLTQSNDRQWWVKERVQSSFSRSFSFPTPINAENIKASFHDGVLEIIVPKNTEDQTKRITIQ
ncbi:HSP20-like chaperone [Blakeslea trispora]|nr:HSP20-like chaperone [Blakeslea trispora]